MTNAQILSLCELNILVKKNLKQCLPDTYWIQAELSDVHVNAPSGHCYVEFVEKNTKNNSLVAKARGTIWANIFPLLKSYFEKETGQIFTSGIKVLVQVSIEFHELYGYSLTVYDIDPTYTLGDMARRRQEILKQLEEEGVQTLNKELPLSPVPNRIAVISSASAAGYGDFYHQLQHNSKGFFFYTELFPAIMQGNQVEETILAALDKIYSRMDEFDAVVIIRGGGAISDLSGFDTYLLVASCAQFALPIITGIGHERDDTVLDSIAHTRVKTPTAAADFLINRMIDTADALTHLTEQLKISAFTRMEQETKYLNFLKNRIPSLTFTCFSDAKLALQTLKNNLARVVTFSLSAQKHQLDLLRQRISDASPERLLSRGYSITMKNGKVVNDVSQLSEGDLFTTRLAKGEITGTVNELR
ncbi:Exodeoxyribonuclease 7 large subunit [termite gut metagenome]|uniref:Exodeoxyribonuclease 7 large subunit n=1 Tax=termite gut metagenome TaxID=433724 RepID=A0A5J4R7Q3_9ZZZZ